MLSFSNCEKHPLVNPCLTGDKDVNLIGAWKLIEECNCYNLGGDFIWKKIFEESLLSFNEECRVLIEASKSTICSSEGNFNSNDGKLVMVFPCPNGAISTNKYDYILSSKNDTLLLKGYVDEGFIGRKFLRKKL